MNDAELEQQAIHEAVLVEPYSPSWPALFYTERDRLLDLAPELVTIEHIGSTAVPGLAAKPIIDMLAPVFSLEVADYLLPRLCANGYITSADFNRSLGNRRWLMRHADGHRTHHLHLLLSGSPYWVECIRFRDVLRQDDNVRDRYAVLKRSLAAEFDRDRDGYGNAKTAFIASAVRFAG